MAIVYILTNTIKILFTKILFLFAHDNFAFKKSFIFIRFKNGCGNIIVIPAKNRDCS